MELQFVFSQNHFRKEPTKEIRHSESLVGNLTDDQLWKEFKAGSEEAFSLIYRKNVSLLYSYGLKIVTDKELIKDCIQDLFVEIWNTKHRLGAVKSIKSYLFKSIRRKLISESVKRRKKLRKQESLVLSQHTITKVEEPDFIISSKESPNEQKLRVALEHLTSRQKEIVYLKYFSKLTYVEIADTMELSIKGTYKLMGRSIGFLRKYMVNDHKVNRL
ncbi:RNA polymerase sigma factor [Pareuzebyella sediminis]|uniref:RNA polymerase sigma factor n=1 Tax=Pareuzebyella sediminis TaxID=2607998 RepID=UPI0018E0EE68|nr:sigma-70 family RNA polymerase sigma factor [Pareuzebyella sediminis]